MPIYPGTEALPSRLVTKAVHNVLDQLGPDGIASPPPEELWREAELANVYTVYRWVYRPEDSRQQKTARRRLRREGALILQVTLAQRRAHHKMTCTTVVWSVPEEEGSLRTGSNARPPYDLTAGQKRVGKEIPADLTRIIPMQRFPQGDMGSSKTLVAPRATLRVIGGGGRAALLASTEVLTAQYYSSLKAVLGPMVRLGMLSGAEHATRIHLLTGSTPATQHRRIPTDLTTGGPAVVVGTHALLSDTVQVPFLGLVAVDEQHRLGVTQYGTLCERGGLIDPATGQTHAPHLLVMIAAPIPRTIAMTIFGDLATSVLDELPAGCGVVSTHLALWSHTPWMKGIWRCAAKEVASGGRVYVAYPQIEADDESRHTPIDDAAAVEIDDGSKQEASAEGGDGPHLDRPPAAVEDQRRRLAGELVPGGIGVGVLTGRMGGEDKTIAMASFASDSTPVLISTTVIEVGVDVPEAPVMVILDTERFELSRLHQLHGWIGHGSKPSLCVTVIGAGVGSTTFHRLKAFAFATDGLALAKVDLELRSEGDVLGTSQSGRTSGLDLLRVARDARLIVTARCQAEQAVVVDPQLSDHRALAAAAVEYLDGESQTFLGRA